MKRLFWTFNFLWILRSALFAGDLTWDFVRSIAQKNNPALKASYSKVESFRTKVKESRGNFFPQLTGGGSFSKSNSATSLESVSQGGSGSGTRDEVALNLTAQQPLFAGFKNQSNLESARIDFTISEADHSLLESKIFRDLKGAFLSVLYSKEKIELVKKIFERKQENRKLIELRYEGGREPRGTLLRAKAQESQAKFEVERAQREYRLSRNNLVRQMGQDFKDSSPVKGDLELKKIEGTPNYKSLVLNHPTYKKSELALKKARAAIVEARSVHYPNISLSATGKRRGRDFPPESDSWSVVTSFSYPLFSGGKDYFSNLRSKLELEGAQVDLDKIRGELIFNLESVYVNLENGSAQTQVEQDFLQSAQERAKVSRTQYGQGLITYTDWDLIETDLTNTEKEMLEGRLRAAIAEADWINAQGKSGGEY